jgi:hypothetical protein
MPLLPLLPTLTLPATRMCSSLMWSPSEWISTPGMNISMREAPSSALRNLVWQPWQGCGRDEKVSSWRNAYQRSWPGKGNDVADHAYCY